MYHIDTDTVIYVSVLTASANHVLLLRLGLDIIVYLGRSIAYGCTQDNITKDAREEEIFEIIVEGYSFRFSSTNQNTVSSSPTVPPPICLLLKNPELKFLLLRLAWDLLLSTTIVQ